METRENKPNGTEEKGATMNRDETIKDLATEFVDQMSVDDLRGFSRAAWYEGAALHLAHSDQDAVAGIQIRDFMNAIEDAVRVTEAEVEEPPIPQVRICSCTDGFSYPEGDCPDCGGRGEVYDN